MADWPVDSLGGKTLLQAADTPNMDRLARMGRTGRLVTVADGFHPGSEVANMSVLGYNLPRVYEGRGPLEAASIGVDLKPGEMAMRCNIICIEGDHIKNHSAGHITTEEADVLSWWLGYGYLNVVVTVRQQGKHLFHFVEDEVTTDAGGSRRVRLTLYHAVESEVQDYTKRGYLSVPLQQYFTEGVRSLDVTLCVHTASGVKTLELKQIGRMWKEGVF